MSDYDPLGRSDSVARTGKPFSAAADQIARSLRARANRRPIRSIGVSNYSAGGTGQTRAMVEGAGAISTRGAAGQKGQDDANRRPPATVGAGATSAI
jgi:hypothetical protein